MGSGQYTGRISYSQAKQAVFTLAKFQILLLRSVPPPHELVNRPFPISTTILQEALKKDVLQFPGLALGVFSPIVVYHLLRYVIWVAKRCVSAGTAIGAASPATVAGAINVVRACARSGIARNRLLDELLPNVVVGLRAVFRDCRGGQGNQNKEQNAG